ncbi:MAG: tetratricopeptide repeat protein [Methanomicrobiales archaeon]|jgi:tetratricopeptide (TPR) repeat protein|nr:tetratricopeptide repeat protein [Methanomicrobiales archaeon]
MMSREESAGVWYHKGQTCCTTGKFDRAIVCYNRALEISPDDPVVWKRKGFVLLKIGRYNEAVACYDRALELDPEDATAWQRKGYALAHLGAHADAIACCDRAIALSPERIIAWQSRGWLLGLMCRYGEATDCYEKVLAIDPGRDSAAWHRERMCERRDLEALASEVREAEQSIEVPACIREVIAERDYRNIELARAVVRELARQAGRPVVRRP